MSDFQLTNITEVQSHFILSKLSPINAVPIASFMEKLDEVNNEYDKSSLLWVTITITVIPVLGASPIIFICIKTNIHEEKTPIEFALRFVGDMTCWEGLGETILLQGYYPLCRGSSGTEPMAVDREQNTITDVCNGIYSGLRYDPQ